MTRRLRSGSARRDARWWLAAAIIAASAAAASYLLDSEQGRSRRLGLVQRARSVLYLPASAAAAEERWPEEPPPDVDSEAAAGS